MLIAQCNAMDARFENSHICFSTHTHISCRSPDPSHFLPSFRFLLPFRLDAILSVFDSAYDRDREWPFFALSENLFPVFDPLLPRI